MRTVITQRDDTIDLVCHREYGKTMSVTELVMESNPSIVSPSMILPSGTRVVLPDPPTDISQKQQTRLW